jgi:hypothetical protein
MTPDSKPNFRRGSPGPTRHQPAEWVHEGCDRYSTNPPIQAQYPGTCASCLERIHEGDMIAPYE